MALARVSHAVRPDDVAGDPRAAHLGRCLPVGHRGAVARPRRADPRRTRRGDGRLCLSGPALSTSDGSRRSGPRWFLRASGLPMRNWGAPAGGPSLVRKSCHAADVPLVLGALMATGLVVSTGGLASAAGQCSLVVPSKVTIDQPYRDVPIAAVHRRVPGIEAAGGACEGAFVGSIIGWADFGRTGCGRAGTCRGARSHAFDCAENRPQKITTACHRVGRAATRAARRAGAVAGITPRRVRSHAGQLFYTGYEKAMIVLLWFFFLWWRPTPTSTSRPLLN